MSSLSTAGESPALVSARDAAGLHGRVEGAARH